MFSVDPLTPSVKQQNIPISLAIGLDWESQVNISAETDKCICNLRNVFSSAFN